MKSKRSFSAQVRAELYSLPQEAFDENRAFVRECFLAGGTLSDPNGSYHLEFTLDTAAAKKLIRILREFDLHPKKSNRRSQLLVYIKEASEIADVLNIMMAHKSLLIFENIRVEKDLRNNLNRKINFETANLNKTVHAALSQIEAIRFINAQKVPLPKPLAEVAELRMQYETASLEEIGAMLAPPIGKSGVNHRLRKIHAIAKELKKQEADQID